MSALSAPLAPSPTATGGRLVTTDGRALPFQGGSLSVDAVGGLARVVLRQRFVNPHAEALRVTYQVPLPSDGAVSGFAFELDGQRIVGEVDRKGAARERFEAALVEGRTAALLEQDRSSLFTQEVGNLPPGATVVCELVIDQALVWHAPTGGWEWRFPTVVAPRFLGDAGATPDAHRVTVDVAEAGTPARVRLALRVGDVRTGAIASPSHPLHVVGDEVGLSSEDGAALDRDVVVRWPVAAPAAGAAVTCARGGRGEAAETTAGWLTLVPPTVAGAALPRDLILLLDTSGSMGGRPLAQAQAVTCALIDSLGDADQLQLVEFSTRPRAWKRRPVAATARNKAAATTWVRSLRAGGGTQMKDGILAALERVRGEAQRQVVLVTDGLIGFEQVIVGEILRRLPRSCRVHTLGIGSSVNRSLLTPAARAGGGVELIVGLDESADAAARALVAATAQPLVVDLELGGTALVESVAHRPPDLLAGRPARLALRLKASGGTLTVRGHTARGPWEQELTVAPLGLGEGNPALVTRVGRERVEELELRAAAGESVDDRVEALGLAYQVATRRTSWVAVHAAQTVDPTRPTRAERVPQALPHGMSVDGLGLRPAHLAAPRGAPVAQTLAMPMPAPALESAGAAAPRSRSRKPAPKRSSKGLFRRMADAFGGAPPAPPEAAPMAPPPPMAADEEMEFDAMEDLAEAPVPTALGRASDEADRAAPGARAHPLRARVVLATDGRLVLEITLPADLDWPELLEEAQASLGGHRTVRLSVDRAATTAAGALSAHAVVRVVLTGAGLEAMVEELVWLRLASEDGPVFLTL